MPRYPGWRRAQALQGLQPARAIPAPATDPFERISETDAIGGWLHGLTLEDTETEPVPTGCPQCWLTGGGKCSKCPLLRDRNASTPDAVLGC